MTKYETISVPEGVKRELEAEKGEDEWGDFLLRLNREAKRLKGEKAFGELAELLEEGELDAMEHSLREFSKEFSVR